MDIVFLPNSNAFLWGLLPRLAPVRFGAAATPGSGEGSGGFRSLPVQMADEVPDGSSADSRQSC